MKSDRPELIEQAARAVPAGRCRAQVRVAGVVQGIGFRPFIYQLARAHALAGSVGNTAGGVEMEVEGEAGDVTAFLAGVAGKAPAHARIDRLETQWLSPAGLRGFRIRESDADGDPTALILPDLAICVECVREIFDPANRRHRHPFTNCTHCGPRYSIIEGVPYDRARTSMRIFPMCAGCRAEYEDPADRRFHAQPNACPACGPRLALWSPAGVVLSERDEALRTAAGTLRAGRIVAVKGVGGFQLMVAADQPEAVARLRARKRREEKPFALMVGDVAAARQWCAVSALEELLLQSSEAPIVLLERRSSSGAIASLDGVAPGLSNLGVMLPYSALHHLLVRAVGGPLVATSGNVHDEPICIDEHEAVARLGSIADCFLVHDRPVVRPVDDSVVRVVNGRELVLRRARGYAPLPIGLAGAAGGGAGSEAGRECSPVILAVGGHLKNTVALGLGTRVFLSQHVGDLETLAALAAHERAGTDLQRLHRVRAERVAADAHPGYASTQAALVSGLPVIRVQHHYAHLLACLAENGLEPPALGVIWDGTGDGGDGTIWGGEWLVARAGGGFDRAGWLRTFPLPGGEAAVREPRRAALGLLYELMGEAVWERGDLPTLEAFTRGELAALRGMLRRGVQSPRTSSVGRLFDAVASLTGLRQVARYEGQAAMELEAAAASGLVDEPGLAADGAALVWREAGPGQAGWVADWGPLVMEMIEGSGARAEGKSARWARWLHEALTGAVVGMAGRVGLEHVALSGGCFQNRLLTERTIERLAAAGFRPCWHWRVPPNDGGLALGQVVAASQEQGQRNGRLGD